MTRVMFKGGILVPISMQCLMPMQWCDWVSAQPLICKNANAFKKRQMESEQTRRVREATRREGRLQDPDQKDT